MNAVMVALTFALMAYTIPASMLAPLLPAIEKAYHVGAVAAVWISLVPLLAGAALTPSLSRLGDVMGWHKRMALIGLGCLILGGLLSVASDSLVLLLAGRFFTGAGAVVYPMVVGMANSSFTPLRRKVAVSLFGAGLMIGFGIGGVLAGWYLEHHGAFRNVFWGSVVLGVAGLALVGWAAPPDRRPAGFVPRVWWRAVDPWGALGFALTAFTLDVAFSQGSSWGWGSWRVVALIVSALVIFAGWIIVERRLSDPLVPQKVFWSRPVWVSNALQLLAGFGSYGAIIAASTYAQLPNLPGLGGFGSGPVAGAWIVVPVECLGVVAAPVTALLSRRMGKGPYLVMGPLVQMIGLLLAAAYHASYVQLLGSMAVVGVGTGMTLAASTLVYAEDAPADQVGRLFGMATIFAGVGGSLGGAIFGAYATGETLPGLSLPSARAFEHYWQLCAGLSLLAALCACFYLVTYWDGLRGRDKAVVVSAVPERSVSGSAG
ncbi:MFS transporter [Streptomyces sp. NPDC048002]|uniref:MFS transporter n=1 Tax=Streptomyces sp. NPDC048002 TaxID=3154344 RepID=UPI003411B0A4